MRELLGVLADRHGRRRLCLAIMVLASDATRSVAEAASFPTIRSPLSDDVPLLLARRGQVVPGAERSAWGLSSRFRETSGRSKPRRCRH